MPERFMRGIEVVNGIVWGPVGLGLLFGTGLLLTVRTGGFQLRRWGYWMRHTLGAILTDRSVTAHTAREEQAISQFQSLCTALASTIGTGNLVGVSTAILSGGAGAVFWMWVMALLGMMTSYAENVLGIYYRRKDPAGGWRGGPMYYLRDGLGGKPGRVLAVLFAAFCALASFGIGNLSQLNSIAGNLKAAFGVPEAVTGAVLAAVSAVILLGGLKRVAAVAERLVPAMALLYIVGALTVVGVHITAVPAALAAIVKGAFGLRAAGGGIVGYGLSRAVTWGFKRGAFSNEAGLGSSVMVHAASNVKEPVQQGMWGIFEVFADTMVVCTLTALVVLTSGFVDLDTGRIAAGAAYRISPASSARNRASRSCAVAGRVSSIGLTSLALWFPLRSSTARMTRAYWPSASAPCVCGIRNCAGAGSASCCARMPPSKAGKGRYSFAPVSARPRLNA